MNINLGIRFHDTKQLPFEERVKEIRKQGFSCTHIALSKAFDDINTDVSALTPGFAMHLKNVFSKNDLDVAVLGCYLNLAHPDPVQLKMIQERYEANLRFASVLGAGVVGTETGAPNAEYAFCPECRTQEAFDTFVKGLKPVVSYAEKCGVILAIEPVCRHIVWNPKQARRLLDTIESPNLQIILDPVNLLDMDNYKYQVEIVDEAIDLIGKETAVIHIKDFAIEGDQMLQLPAGTGMMNYDSLMKFIKRDKPFIQCTLEETSPENAVKSREFIEKLYAKA